MKSRRNQKLAREEWITPANAIVERPQSAMSAQITKFPRAGLAHDRAHIEWMQWAHVAAARHVTEEPEEHHPLPRVYETAVEKPGRDEWMKWAQVVIDRLTTCVHTYSKPPHEDVFMPEKERQEKNGKTLDLLRRVHALTDEVDTPTDSLTELEHHDERVMSGLRGLLEETKGRLPELSRDMQKLLKSPWFENCNGRVAEELFRGAEGNLAEGLGSGYPEHGRLAASLEDLLDRERTGDGRHPREELRGPNPQMRWQEDLQRRWGRHNLHSAGRVD
jgi:hypothetical protein